jgi:nitroreductase
MILLTRPVIETIQQRFSCRMYQREPISQENGSRLQATAQDLKKGPLGSPLRFMLVAAAAQDASSLRGLGTYGTIKDPAGFLLGVVGKGEKNLEDFGYGLQSLILLATELGLGTCWLGGFFAKSAFARKINPAVDEILPAVVSTGYPQEDSRKRDWMRKASNGDMRLPWESLFFNGQFDRPLEKSDAADYALPLEMVRLAPSASNKQPWRIILQEDRLHFYLRRTPGYGKGSFSFWLLDLPDLQRVDMGIAMCHFELTANAVGLKGRWVIQDPPPFSNDLTSEYCITWVPGTNLS